MIDLKHKEQVIREMDPEMDIYMMDGYAKSNSDVEHALKFSIYAIWMVSNCPSYNIPDEVYREVLMKDPLSAMMYGKIPEDLITKLSESHPQSALTYIPDSLPEDLFIQMARRYPNIALAHAYKRVISISKEFKDELRGIWNNGRKVYKGKTYIVT